MLEMPRRAIRTAAAAFLIAALVSGCFVRASAAETLFERAKNLYDVREYKIALAYFEKVIESEPENGEAWDFAGWCHRYNGDWESALTAFARAKELLPGERSKWVNVGEGEAYYGAGVYESAVNAFAEAISLAPDDEELAVRSAKGIIYTYAALNDRASMEQALADLGKKYPGAENGIEGEADALLAKALERAANGSAASVDDISTQTAAQNAQKITDFNDRLFQAVNDLTSGDVTRQAPEAGISAGLEEPPVSDDDAPPYQTEPVETGAGDDTSADREGPAKDDAPEAKSWEIPALGAPIADVLAKFGEDGISASKAEVATSEGLWLYVLAFPSGIEVPGVTGEKPDSQNSRIEEFDGKLLAVVITDSWENHENSVVFKDELFTGTVAAMNAEIGGDAIVHEADLFSEAQWVSADKRQLIVLSVSATLEGNVTAEKVYNDLAGLNVWGASLNTAGEGD
ncbi:MAG: tetratricopeptide repeat protein [Synergistaceae bacterium]|jgi:tetratricopeptide (TPR) repeat protein|nr:tetratricopeptide repeat protein [Synergistaceae bacterium]